MKRALRVKSVGTKVSAAELRVLESRAAAAGLTLSEWVRAALLGSSRAEKAEAADAAGELVGEVLLSEILALRALFLNLRPLPDHAVPSEGEVRAEIARVDATKMQRARERLAAQKKASEAAR